MLPAMVEDRAAHARSRPPLRLWCEQAHNGSGKTTCFALAMLSRVDPALRYTRSADFETSGVGELHVRVACFALAARSCQEGLQPMCQGVGSHSLPLGASGPWCGEARRAWMCGPSQIQSCMHAGHPRPGACGTHDATRCGEAGQLWMSG